eukprot:gene9385-10365_t
MNATTLRDLRASINQIEKEVNEFLYIQANWLPPEQRAPLIFDEFRETINHLRILLIDPAANYPVNTLNEIGVLLRSIEQLLYNYNHANNRPVLDQTIINDYTTRLNELRAELVGVPDNHAGKIWRLVVELVSWRLMILCAILAVVVVVFYSSHDIRSSVLRQTQHIVKYNPMENIPTENVILMTYKETGAKHEMSEEMNDEKKPRSDRHTIGANDTDSSAESEWSGVNTAGVKLSSEAVDLSNEHAEVSLSGEVASSNNDEGQRVLSVVDEDNHHNENNHWTSSMNDENKLGQDKSENDHKGDGLSQSASAESSSFPSDQAPALEVSNQISDAPPLSGGGARDDGCSDEDIQGGKTALHLASHQGYLEVARLLLESGSNVDQVDTGNHTALHYAVHGCHKEVVELLIARSADVNAVGQGGKTALHLASHQGYLEVARLLLESGSNVDQVDTDKHTALHYAAHECRKEVAELLIARSADVNAKEQHGKSALFYAINQGCSSVAELLLLMSEAVNVDIIDMWGNTTLHYATEQNMVTVVQSLCQRGARKDMFNKLGFTPLHLAVQKGNIDMVEVLLEAGANINQASWAEKQTVVHMAAKRGDKKLLRYLLDLGAQCDVLDEDGHSAYALAKDAGHDYLLDLLKNCPAAK